jgi:integrase
LYSFNYLLLSLLKIIVSVVRFRPRAPLLSVNLLINFTFSLSSEKVWDFLQDFRVKHTYVRDGVYYYERRVPKDLERHYPRQKMVFSLRTKSVKIARSLAQSLTLRLDQYWSALRVQRGEMFALNLFPTEIPVLYGDGVRASHADVTLDQAKQIYLKHKGAGRPDTFHRAAERTTKYLSEAIGEKTIGNIQKTDAILFRDYLVTRGLKGPSIGRVFGNARTIINIAFSELGIDKPNPFSGVFIDTSIGSARRNGFKSVDLLRLKKICHQYDDELRHILALICDTGMRLSEAVGLRHSDLALVHQYPHVMVQPNAHRRLKTASSTRSIPLVGDALWAAKRLASKNQNGEYLITRYNRYDRTDGNSASAALNKWLKQNEFVGYSVHSLRHSFRDRLREVECPVDIANQLGDWMNKGIGSQYGYGYQLGVLSKWMRKIV